ncbi:hypothetical protein Val02_21810 [Virgisporangium aliadipatigenens]|uniref:DUF6973 domain-containing protein n=1 Tax=Virgisporangium aliadipatigenens TaxID=741659 RepID=A0A8J4DNV3_9ACTN|nr:hypothetical protein Val02_21810 [Virgisporangium aliadipatigenens]
MKYIEEMSPDRVTIAERECQRVVRLIGSTQGTLDRARSTVVWADRSSELFDRRLRQADRTFEQLMEGYTKAARALNEYIAAQREAQRLVAEGVRVEDELREILAYLARTHPPLHRLDPMEQWAFWAGRADPDLQEEIDRVRADADLLYHRAAQWYDRARRTEADARGVAVTALRAARRLLPELRGDSAAAKAVIAGTPGLRAEIEESARLDPDPRRPGEAVLTQYQVRDDARREQFPAEGNPLARLAHETVQHNEARMLEELYSRSPVDGWLPRFNDIRNEANAEALRRYPTPDQNDDHFDAFRHTYWSALLTSQYGEDWARRYTSAHEELLGNPAPREAMDLYNNEVGRAIALANPGASERELADLAQAAVREGRSVVVGRDGRTLEFSDQIDSADTGTPRPNHILPGRPQPGPPAPP